MNIKKGDTVKIIQGRDSGKKGKVIQVFPDDHKIVVEGLNLSLKNVRAKKAGEKGQRVKFAAPINASNVMLFCPKCSKQTRIGFKRTEKEKIRVCKKCKQLI